MKKLMMKTKKMLVKTTIMTMACAPLFTMAQAAEVPAIVLAASRGQAAAVTALLEKGADPNKRQANGRTALMEAAIRGDFDIVRMLMIHGADKDLKDSSGRTAFDFAVEKKYADIIALLRDAS